MKKYLSFVLSVAGILLLVGWLAPVPTSKAESGQQLTGYAWSSNIGWIGFDKVFMEGGSLRGYAWSPNIGWIQFSPSLSGPDGGSGVSISGNSVNGWFRACSVFKTGCSGDLRDDSERGSWDGWIKMHNAKYDSQTGRFGGFAWGGLNVGWVDLAPKVTLAGCTEPSCNPTDPLGGTCEANNTCNGNGGCDPKVRVCGTGTTGESKIDIICQNSSPDPENPITMFVSKDGGNDNFCGQNFVLSSGSTRLVATPQDKFCRWVSTDGASCPVDGSTNSISCTSPSQPVTLYAYFGNCGSTIDFELTGGIGNNHLIRVVKPQFTGSNSVKSEKLTVRSGNAGNGSVNFALEKGSFPALLGNPVLHVGNQTCDNLSACSFSLSGSELRAGVEVYLSFYNSPGYYNGSGKPIFNGTWLNQIKFKATQQVTVGEGESQSTVTREGSFYLNLMYSDPVSAQ